MILTNYKSSKLATLVGLFVFVYVSAATTAQENNEQELIEIQTQIQSKQQNLSLKMKTADSLQEQLRTAEIEISKLTKETILTRQNLAGIKEEQATLQKQQTKLTKQKQTQQQQLASQIKSAYMAGNHDYTKLLLNQENAGKFERMLVYYRYLNAARQSQIDQFTQLMTELESLNARLEAKQLEVAEVEKKQEQQRQSLLMQQKSRETTLASLRNTIDSDAAQIEQLQINEQQLAKAINDAIAVAESKQNIVLNGLRTAKGKLPTPVSGKYRRLFGKRRQGQVKWKGVIFESSAGRPVSAIHQGKVLYADWLKGLGLVTVIDHGEGYMSLYGHNQALLRQVGDVVDAGETIALVGQSGGQSRAGLYFELRHKGQAINPSSWLKI